MVDATVGGDSSAFMVGLLPGLYSVKVGVDLGLVLASVFGVVSDFLFNNDKWDDEVEGSCNGLATRGFFCVRWLCESVINGRFTP